MNKFIFFISILIIIVFSCAREQKATIKFCSSITLNEPCVGENTEFPVRSKVWVLCELNSPSDGEIIKGKLFILKRNKKVLLGAQDFQLEPGERHAIDYMIFNDRGEYIVEFFDEEGNSLVKKRINIL